MKPSVDGLQSGAHDDEGGLAVADMTDVCTAVTEIANAWKGD